MHNVNKSLMFPLFLYLQAATSSLLPPPPHLLRPSCSSLSPGCDSLLFLSLLSPSSVLTKTSFVSLVTLTKDESSHPPANSRYFLCILLRSTGEFTCSTVRCCLLSFKSFCGFQRLRRISRMYSPSVLYTSSSFPPTASKRQCFRKYFPERLRHASR